MTEKCDAKLQALTKEFGKPSIFFNSNVVFDSQGNSCTLSNDAFGELKVQNVLDARQTKPCGFTLGKGQPKSSAPGRYVQAPKIESCDSDSRGGNKGGGDSGGNHPD